MRFIQTLCSTMVVVLYSAFLCAGLYVRPSVADPGAEPSGSLEMWRLDCGTMDIEDISYFSNSGHYDGQSAFLTNGCYLVRNGDQYLLWDAGLSHRWQDNQERVDGWLSTFTNSVAQQLRMLGLSPDNITYLGTSHFHGDHIGQAGDFTGATLIISEADAQWIRKNPPGNARTRLASWFSGRSEMTEFSNDHDVFGDGSVTILGLPGHTPGHSGLLVRLPETGPVLLSGDLYHFHNEVGTRIVSQWNHDRADTLASIDRFEAMIENLDPVVVVQHDPDDVVKLPAFPESAR